MLGTAVTYDGNERHDLTHVPSMCIDHGRLGLSSPSTSPPEVLGPGSRRVCNMRRHEHSPLFSVALAVGIISVIAFTLLAAAVYLGAI